MNKNILVTISFILLTACASKDIPYNNDEKYKEDRSMECNKILTLSGAIAGGTVATVVVDKTFKRASKPLKLFLSGLGIIMGGAFACILGQEDKKNIKNFIETAKEGDSIAWANQNRNNLRVAIRALKIEEKNNFRIIKYQIRSEIEKDKFT